MPEITINNTLVCASVDTREIVYVSNTGRLASVNDRVPLRNDGKGLESRPKSVGLDSPGINGQLCTEVVGW